MKKNELTEEQVKAAFQAAESGNVKDVLTAMFPDVAKELTKKKPSLDDYETITSYEDACEALGHAPVDFDMLWPNLPKHIIALMKLETISRALWGRNWEPKPNAEGEKLFYWPWFYLWTKEEMDILSDDRKGALLSAGADNGASAGFGCLGAYYRSSNSNAYGGFRLCQETEEKARYFGSRHFVKLWAEYMRFNFETGDFLIDE